MGKAPGKALARSANKQGSSAECAPQHGDRFGHKIFDQSQHFLRAFSAGPFMVGFFLGLAHGYHDSQLRR